MIGKFVFEVGYERDHYVPQEILMFVFFIVSGGPF